MAKFFRILDHGVALDDPKTLWIGCWFEQQLILKLNLLSLFYDEFYKSFLFLLLDLL